MPLFMFTTDNDIVEKIGYLNMRYNYWDDGKKHINIITSSKNANVRKLNDLALNEFTHPIYGKFKCLRGIFYWLTVENPSEKIREKYADNLYRGIARKQKYSVDKLKLYRQCVGILLETNPEFRHAFLEVCKLNLPIVSYRYSGNTFTFNKYHSELIIVYNEFKQKMEDSHALSREVD